MSLQRIFWPSSGNYGQGAILAALTYTTNWFEMVRGGTYFGEFGQPSLLLHTWSLAIEEQYYLLFPLILLLVLSFVRSRRAVAWVMLALAGMSAAWMAFLSQSGASELRLYMGTDTRAQSLLVGAAVGCLLGRRQGTVAFRSIDVIGGLGLIVLVATMVAVKDPTTLYRGGFLLQAAAAAAVIIAVLQPGSLARIFSWRPLVWVGSISYSVYLWHFPIFAWIQGHDEFPAAIGAQLWSWVLTLLVALVSQRLVERPFLAGPFVRWPVWRQWLLYLVTAGVMAVSCLVPAGAFARAQSM